MITTEELKDYLHIPYNDDDAFIQRILDTGYGYLEDAIDNYKALYKANARFRGKADLWVMTQWGPHMYDQREGMSSIADAGLNYGARAMLTQLQFYRLEEK